MSIPKSQPPAVQYLHPDALGSSPLGTGQSGDLASAVDQEPYGLRRFEKLNGDLPLPTRSYTGKELDPSSWYYFGARYFSPEMARFTQVDPAVLSFASDPDLRRIMLTDPQRLHPYAYALNNPIRYVDSDGAIAETVIDAVSVAFDIQQLRSHYRENGRVRISDLAWLAVDLVSTAVPFVPAVGAIRWVDKAADATRGAAKAIGISDSTLAHVMNPVIKHGAKYDTLSGGHYLPNYLKSGLDTTGLAVDAQTKVPYLYYGAREGFQGKFQSFFREGFTPRQIQEAGNRLQGFSNMNKLSAGEYVRYMDGDAYYFAVEQSGKVGTFTHTIPRLLDKPGITHLNY